MRQMRELREIRQIRQLRQMRQLRILITSRARGLGRGTRSGGLRDGLLRDGRSASRIFLLLDIGRIKLALRFLKRHRFLVADHLLL
jgi:hypothetical protein